MTDTVHASAPSATLEPSGIPVPPAPTLSAPSEVPSPSQPPPEPAPHESPVSPPSAAAAAAAVAAPIVAPPAAYSAPPAASPQPPANAPSYPPPGGPGGPGGPAGPGGPQYGGGGPSFGGPAPVRRSGTGFFSSLFDFSFTSFVTPKIIKFIYILTLALIALGILAFVIAGFARSFGYGLLMLVIVAPIMGVVYLLLARLWLEVVIVLFRMEEHLEELVKRK